MKYDEAISALNSADICETEKKLDKLKNRELLSDKEANLLLTETIGKLFSVCKECKDEELYRIEKIKDRPVGSENELWQDTASMFGENCLVFVSNPITPFIEGEAKCGDELLLITYRKAVYENPKLVLIEGISEGSTVMDILQKEGLSNNGKKNYLSICEFIQNETARENKDFAFIAKIAELLSEESGAQGFCYTAEDTRHNVFFKSAAKVYYRCTSSIVCSLVSIEGTGSNTVVKIEPVAHNAEKIEPDKPVEYEDFGEVGCFTFEMADYE